MNPVNRKLSANADVDNILIKVLTEVVKLFKAKLSKNILDIILVGSTSRGEFSGKLIGEKIHSYSDLEFVVLKRGIIGRSLRNELKLETALIVEKYFCSTGYEGIDFWLLSESEFFRMDTLFAFEAKTVGVSLIKDSLPSPIFSINRVDLLEICLHRAINMYISLSKFKDEEKLHLAISRNFLDILSVLFFWDGIKVSGYKNRIDSFDKIDTNKIINTFGVGFKGIIELATRHKLAPWDIKVTDSVKARAKIYSTYNSELFELLKAEIELKELRDIKEKDINYSGIIKSAVYKLRHLFTKRNIRPLSVLNTSKLDLYSFTIDSINLFLNDESMSSSKLAYYADQFGVKYYRNHYDLFKVVCLLHYPYLEKKL